MKLFYSTIILFIGQIVFSQTSVIKGTTIEEANGKPLPGVVVVVKNSPFSTVSDFDGNFIIRDIPLGKYDLQFSLYSFQTKEMPGVAIISEEAVILTVSMNESKNDLKEVVITRTKPKLESLNGLITMQKNSIRVSDGISAETIKKTPDKTASDVLKRISGASIQQNKFVIVRGLNDRYNTTYLNGAPLPSSEPDRKAFAFDIFPANMLDNIVVNKTASPDLPGEFAGGNIEIITKSTPDKNFMFLSLGGGYNTATTGKNQLYASGGKSELPSYFPDVTSFKALQNAKDQPSILAIDDLSKKYQTDWELKNKKFDPNLNFQYTLGRFINFKENKNLGILFSVSHSTTNNYFETNRRTYENPGTLMANQLDQTYSVVKLSGGLLNLSFKLNPNNNFSFKNLYSVNSESRVLDRNGSLSQESDPLWVNTTSRFFSTNKIYSGQLAGEHFLTESKIKINWVGSYSNVDRVIPTERRNSYIYYKYDDGTQSVPTANFSIGNVGADYPGSIYTSENKENLYSAKVDAIKKLKFSEDFTTDIKVGGLFQTRHRDFAARQLGYIPFNGTVDGVRYGDNTFVSSIATQPNATIFDSSNMGILGTRKSGLTLYDGTKGTDAYNADSKLNAAYVMFDNAYKKFRLVWGFRLEDFTQTLNSKADKGDVINVDNSKLDVLPSANLIYSLTKTQNLRLSASKTLNRPEFRELAPFVFYDSSTQFSTAGDPTLKNAQIFNADLRYEIYPGKGQLFSVTGFYKDFTNPIELQAQANNTNQYKNAKSGKDLGIETEYRTLMSTLLGTENSRIWDNLTLYTNLAIIRSKVDISNLVTSATLSDIPMQGQSPYIFNAGILYSDKDYGWSFSANLNSVGDRIFIQQNQTAGLDEPAYWEKGRTFLDFQIAKSFLQNKLEFKFNIQNALAQDLIFYQNNFDKTGDKVTGTKAFMNSVLTGDSQDKNGYDSKIDDVAWKTKLGRTFSFTVNYTF